MHAFLAKNYQTAVQVYQDLMIPISEAEIYLGQQEMLDEVLSVDLAECAAQYVASVYMISTRSERAGAVKIAIDDMSAVGYFKRPLHQLERVAIEPLPDFDEFLGSWNDLVSDLANAQPSGEWDTDIDHWHREVTQRLHGTDGLAGIARSTKRASDFRAWCRALVEARDWKAALTAFDEAATSTSAAPIVIAVFLDGAALAAAPGLGWSDREHPGHLIFPIFCRLLGDDSLSDEVRRFGLDEDHRYDDTFAHDGVDTGRGTRGASTEGPDGNGCSVDDPRHAGQG